MEPGFGERAAAGAAGAATRVAVVTTTTTTTSYSVGGILFLLTAIIILAYLATAYLNGGFRVIKRRTVCLLIGPAGAGKTTILKQLQHGKAPASGTVTSLIPNEEEVAVDAGAGEKRAVRVVDFPGHYKLRSGAGKYIDIARQIIFVTDALVYKDSERVREAANFLFAILTTPSVLRDRPTVFVACNKSERMNAFSPEFIRKRLEQEIEVLTRTVDPEEVPGADRVLDMFASVQIEKISAKKGNLKALVGQL
mmetsp:Transcript_6207/g.15087  ORF Transcript_6207/g.15087 Transcript_6207/m.15087 type:complete len:252 (+) Transcript_6207:57-812(+)